MSLVPEVNPGLVADFNWHRKVGEDFYATLNNFIFRFIAQIRVVPIEQVKYP